MRLIKFTILIEEDIYLETFNSFGFFSSTAFLVFLKLAVLLILSIYTIFALMIVRQVGLMNQTLITPVSSVVKFVAIIHLLFAIGLIILAWFIL